MLTVTQLQQSSYTVIATYNGISDRVIDLTPQQVHLASEEAGDITGRVIQAGAGMVAVCEGWRRGAEVPAMADPVELGPHIRDMVSKVRKNSGMDGHELD